MASLEQAENTRKASENELHEASDFISDYTRLSEELRLEKIKLNLFILNLNKN